MLFNTENEVVRYLKGNKKRQQSYNTLLAHVLVFWIYNKFMKIREQATYSTIYPMNLILINLRKIGENSR